MQRTAHLSGHLSGLAMQRQRRGAACEGRAHRRVVLVFHGPQVSLHQILAIPLVQQSHALVHIDGARVVFVEHQKVDEVKEPPRLRAALIVAHAVES